MSLFLVQYVWVRSFEDRIDMVSEPITDLDELLAHKGETDYDTIIEVSDETIPLYKWDTMYNQWGLIQ